MRKVFSILTLLTFVLVMQMSFIHALDMAGVSMNHSAEHEGVLCSKGETTSAKSCFQEISESKWVQSVEEIGLSILVFAALAVFSGLLGFHARRMLSQGFFKRRIFYNPTLYLGLYGIVRNVN